MSTFTSNEHHLLDWLGKEDTSAYGECSGHALNNLIAMGLAEVVSENRRGRDYNRVALTDLGRAELAKLGAWEPFA